MMKFALQNQGTDGLRSHGLKRRLAEGDELERRGELNRWNSTVSETVAEATAEGGWALPEMHTVRFQWKNPDSPLKNPDFLIRNPDFRLNNVDFMIKQAAEWQRRSLATMERVHAESLNGGGNITTFRQPTPEQVQEEAEWQVRDFVLPVMKLVLRMGCALKMVGYVRRSPRRRSLTCRKRRWRST